MSSYPPDKLLTAEEAANYLQVSKARLYRMADTGLLRYLAHGKHSMRFAQPELLSYQLHTNAAGAQLRLPKPASRKTWREQHAPLTETTPESTMTAPAAAAYLGLKLDTFYWRVRHGQIAFLPPVGQRGKRFRKSDLDAYKTGEQEEH